MTTEDRLKNWFLRYYFGPSLFPRQAGRCNKVEPDFAGGLGGNRDELFALFDHYVSTGDLRKLDDGSWERVPERIGPIPEVRPAEPF